MQSSVLPNPRAPETGSRRNSGYPEIALLLFAMLVAVAACGKVGDSTHAEEGVSGNRAGSGSQVSPERKRVSVVTGSVEVPEGYTSTITLSNVDVFGGVIGSASGSLQIHFVTGLNAPWVSPSTRKKFEWVKREQTEAGELLYGGRQEGGRRRVDLTVADANFMAAVEKASDIERVLEVARSYEPGACNACETPKRVQTPQHQKRR
jgi:hypothetical protein